MSETPIPPLSPGEHTCHARDCKTPCKPEKLMCGRHWRMVPKAIQYAVYAAYRPGQCDDKQPSADWHLAADAAIAAVAIQERKISVDQAVKWLQRHGPVDAALVETIRRAGYGLR